MSLVRHTARMPDLHCFSSIDLFFLQTNLMELHANYIKMKKLRLRISNENYRGKRCDLATPSAVMLNVSNTIISINYENLFLS